MTMKIGQRVEILGKDCQGAIAYIGYPGFASGKWIGIILDEPKGKNNGSIKGQTYFKCAENYGMFVRQSQLVLIDEAGNRTEPNSPSITANVSSSEDASAAGASRARSRLSISRINLGGSRTQIADTTDKDSDKEKKEIKETMIPVPTNSKRASFIETGFVETLKPQFIPGQSINAASEEKISYQQIMQENMSIKQQVKDLLERIEILKSKRIQDKDKLKDFEKMRIQLEQLIEFKNKVMESQASLQRELQRARQEARDAHAAREQYQDEMADLAETVELTTLDKEMAEEKVETLQLELDQLKEKLEEQTLDLEILKTEMSEKAGDGKGTGSVSTFEIKQLEQQNARLRETLVRMRDLSAHEKHEYQKLQKDLELKKSEISELRRTKEKLSSRVEEMEHQIIDLQEQVDAALGAEEMVQVLVERKMALEEKVAELEEAVSDLEALQDVSDQVAESCKELELELREELDLALATARNAQRHRDAALENLADRELTIQKFRELTQQLQEKCFELQNRLNSNESNKSSMKGSEQQLAEILEFQRTFAETKAQTKAIDLELRRLDAEEARNHVNYLLLFMPPAFTNRGGDHDAVLTLLLIPRMIQKTDILIVQVRDRYKPVEEIDRSGVLKDHAVFQTIFRYKICMYMYALQTALGSFDSALKVCSSDILLKVGCTYPEMVLHERALDLMLELAKSDQIDENASTDDIEKCCTYFFNLYNSYFCEYDYANDINLVINGTRFLGHACDAMSTEIMSLKCVIKGKNDDITLLCMHIENICKKIRNSLISARKRIPREFITAGVCDESILGLEKDWFSKIGNSFKHSSIIIKILYDLLKESIQALILTEDLESELPQDRINDILLSVKEKSYMDENLGMVAVIKSSLKIVETVVINLSDRMAECENDITINKTQVSSKKENSEENNPIYIRAQHNRKEMEETKVLYRKLEAKETDIREAKLALRKKQEELSEMILRKELAEKRATTQQHEFELTIDKLNRNLEDLKNQLRRKEKEFEETMDHLQTDIDSLESEKGQLKEKLKSIGKKGSQVDNLPHAESISYASHTSTVSDSVMQEKVAALCQLLKNVSCEKNKLLNRNLHKKLDSLLPLPKINRSWANDTKIKMLMQKKHELLREAHNHAIFPIIPDLTKNKPLIATENPTLDKIVPAYCLFEREVGLKKLNNEVIRLNDQVRNEILKRKYGKSAKTQFAVFPEKDYITEKTKSQKPVITEIVIPSSESEDINVLVGTQELRKIHFLFSY